MIHPSRLLAGLALTAAVSAPVLAQTDFLKAPSVACLPDSVTRCANGQCTTRPATQRDRADALVIDFATKKVSIRRGGEARPFADIVEHEQGDDERRFVLGEPGKGGGERVKATLTKAGRLTLVIGTDGSKGEATCTAEP